MSTSENSPSLSPALIRTLVPIVVGPVIARYLPGVDINDPNTLLLTSGIISYAYYVLVRGLEEYAPKVGWLLGIAKRPVYSAAPAVSPGPDERLETVVVPDVDDDDDDFSDMDLGDDRTVMEDEVLSDEQDVPVVERHDPAVRSVPLDVVRSTARKLPPSSQ